MDSDEFVFLLIVGMIVLAIMTFITANLYTSGIIEATKGNLTEPSIVQLLNEKVPPGNLGPVTIPRPDLVGDTYFYKITVIPKVRSTGKYQLSVIPIIRFKGQSLRATANGISDKFTLSPDETPDENLTVDISTSIPPIRDAGQNCCDKPLRENMPVLVRSHTSSMLVTVSINRVDSMLPDFIAKHIYNCYATFTLECANAVKFMDPMKGCTSDGKPSDCQQSLELCGGTGTVTIYDKPDCSAKSVRADISYEGGKEWSPGEKVYLSFWKDTTCTKKLYNFRELLVLCPEDRLGGEFELNAGLIQN